MNPNEETFKLPDEIEDVESPLPFGDFRIVDHNMDDIEEEIASIDGYREYLRDNNDDSLTFGDY